MLRVAYLNTTSSLITTCGADGKAIIWEYSEDNPAPHDISTEPKIASSSLNGNVHQDKKRLRKQAMLSHGEAQIYACECLDVDNSSSGMFMTAAESSVYLWDINVSLSTKLSSSPTHIWTVNTNSSNNSSLVNAPGDDSGFGGPRNPQNQIYIFDAKINPQCGSNIALALSDCNIQQIDLRTPALVSSNGLATPFSSSMKNSSGSSLKQSSSNGNFDSISLSGFSTSSTKKARVGNSHATSVSFTSSVK